MFAVLCERDALTDFVSFSVSGVQVVVVQLTSNLTGNQRPLEFLQSVRSEGIQNVLMSNNLIRILAPRSSLGRTKPKCCWQFPMSVKAVSEGLFYKVLIWAKKSLQSKLVV